MATLVRATRRRSAARHVPGEEGTWVLILGDMTVFGLLFAVYLSYRADEAQLFRSSQEMLTVSYGLVNTLLLLTSSLFVVTAVRAVRDRVPGVAPPLFAGALVCGSGFALSKFLEYQDKLGAGLKPATNDFFMFYYVLTGIHFFHLILGMGVLVSLWAMSRRADLSDRQLGYLEGGACFWHMVDLLWIVLFPLLYLLY